MAYTNTDSLFEYVLSQLPDKPNETDEPDETSEIEEFSETECIVLPGICSWCNQECNPSSQVCGLCVRNPPTFIYKNVQRNMRKSRANNMN